MRPVSRSVSDHGCEAHQPWKIQPSGSLILTTGRECALTNSKDTIRNRGRRPALAMRNLKYETL